MVQNSMVLEKKSKSSCFKKKHTAGKTNQGESKARPPLRNVEHDEKKRDLITIQGSNAITKRPTCPLHFMPMKTKQKKDKNSIAINLHLK